MYLNLLKERERETLQRKERQCLQKEEDESIRLFELDVFYINQVTILKSKEQGI